MFQMIELTIDETLNEILEQMKSGDADWQMPWHGSNPTPINVKHGGHYSGFNRVILWSAAKANGFKSRYWGTFNQWRARQQPVSKGSHGTRVFRPEISKNRTTGAQELEGFRHFALFNGDQVLHRNEDHPDLFAKVEISHDVEKFIAASRADIRFGCDYAFYSPQHDHIGMPHIARFTGSSFSTPTQAFYATLLHELIHWTGHPARQSRPAFLNRTAETYAFEELVAELGAAFLCAEFDLANTPRKDHAQYLNSWLRLLGDRPRQLLEASRLAQKAMESLLKTPQAEHEEDDTSEPDWFQPVPWQPDLLAPKNL
jgi:antirestriction protein ArdC